jgi:hypothetical protein
MIPAADLTVWLFRPTDRFLVALAYTAYDTDRAVTGKLHEKLRIDLKTAGLLHKEHPSKTRQYCKSHFGK